MKRFVLSLLLLASLLPCMAQKEKVVERSARKVPEWLGKSSSDCFSVVATAPELGDAQRWCLEDIRQHIVTTIAANITSEERFRQEQSACDGVVSLLSHYASDVTTQGAAIPYLCGISLSRASDVYWERRFVREKKSYYYICHVRYPFSALERAEAIEAFRSLDAARYARLKEIEEEFGRFTELSWLEQAATALDPLIGYFFDSDRRRLAENLQQRCRQACGEVALVCDSARLGACYYHFTLHGRCVTTDRAPRLRSDYATALRVMRNGEEGYVLLYDEAGIAGEENTVEAVYTFGGRRLRHLFTFDPDEGKVAVRPYGTVGVERIGCDASGCPLWRVCVPLRAKTDTRFEVLHAELRLPESGHALRAESEEPLAAFEGRGEHTLRFETAAPEIGGRRGILGAGWLRVRAAGSRETRDVRFDLPCELIVER